MPVIYYAELSTYISNLTPDHIAPVYLIYGEPFLYQTALNALLDRIFPNGDTSARNFNYESMEGDADHIYEAVSKLNTFSMLAGIKITALCDANIFYQKKDVPKIFEKAKQAYKNEDVKKASGYLLSWLSLRGLKLEDLSQGSGKDASKEMIGELADNPWVDNVVQYCMEKGLLIPKNIAGGPFLEAAIKKGFPKKNHLIITTDIADKRQRLFKTISKTGMVIDCSVPKGEKAADKRVRETVLNAELQKVLSKSNKTMGRDTFNAVYERIGFDLHILMHHMEKLISFVGDRDHITPADVKAVVKRSKQDPIYELTNAIMEKNVENGLFYVNSLLSSGFHPLQILAAMTNQIRRLFVARAFLDTQDGSAWQNGCEYGYFKQSIMPQIELYDQATLREIDSWEDVSMTEIKPNDSKKRKKSKPPKTDLLIAKNPKNPYPIFKLVQSAATVTTESLLDAIEDLGRTDLQLKSSRLSPRLILEKVILSVCRKKL